MEKINKETKMLALLPPAVCNTTSTYKATTPILPEILHTQNTKKTEEEKGTKKTKKLEEREMSVIPSFLHIVTCYQALIKTDRINEFIDYVKHKCNYLDSTGLDGHCILWKIKREMQKFLEYTKQNNDFVLQNLDWFQQRLFDIYLTCNTYEHKTIEPPKITTKFQHLCPIVIRETKIEESVEQFDHTISNIVVMQQALVMYSRHLMMISCVRKDGNKNYMHCPSSATDFTRTGSDVVVATLPFRKMILLISPTTYKIKRIQLGLYLVSYLKNCILIGTKMFGKTVYQFDWEDNKIKYEFYIKETPTDIAVGVQNRILISFSNISKVICYNLDGQQLWEVETHSLHLPIKISLYQSYFYVLQGQIIYRISVKGCVTKRDIGRKCRSISVGKDTILVTDYFDKPHAIATNKDFWCKLSYNHQQRTPSMKDPIYIEDCYKITNILPMSKSSILIIYSNNNVVLFTDNGEIIWQNHLTFLELPSIICRMNSNRFLVFYRKMKGLQYINCPQLSKGPLIKVQTVYTKICYIESNKCLAVTTSEHKNEVHILLINEDKIDIKKIISVRDANVTIAATAINFVVVDGREYKMVFYSTCGEELFEKTLPFYGYPHHIYSDDVYFYVLFKRQSILICYDIYGEMKWQWKLPFYVHPHIALFQGTFYVPDVELNRLLVYKSPQWSSGCYLATNNPYIRNLNIRLKEEETEKVAIDEICHLANGQLVVSDINKDYLLYISKEGYIMSRLPLPSIPTHICRWDSNQIGVTLPLEKQLRVIGNSSKTVRRVSLSQPYVRVCKMGEGEIVCYCDKPSQLDILAIKKYPDQFEIVHTIKIPFLVKSLSMEKKTQKLLIVTRGKTFQYNTRVRGGGGGVCSIQMVPSVLLSHVKRPRNLYGGSIDQRFVYLIDNSHIFSINDDNLVVNDLVTNNQLNIYIDMVDVFNRNISASEMLSSTLHLQDLTVSDKGRHIHLSQHLRDKQPVGIKHLVITENNLITVWDRWNENIKIFTFDGEVLDAIKWNFYDSIRMYRWQSNTLVITNEDYPVTKYQLMTLKMEFPLSLVIYQTRNQYEYIASLSNNQLVCHKESDGCHLYFINIDEEHLRVNEVKQIDIPETLLMRYNDDGDYINDIEGINVTAEDVIIVCNRRFFIFFDSDGQCLYSVRHYMQVGTGWDDIMTIDDRFLYIQGGWDKYLSPYNNIVCLTQTGEYNRTFLNQRIYKEELNFFNINCKGPRFVANLKWSIEELYVEGLFMVNRDSFPISRLQTDDFAVQVKDFDVSHGGMTVVCEKVNNGNVKIFDEDGRMLRHRNVASLVGGVCFTQETHIMATLPQTRQLFQLNGEDLQTLKVWPTRIPYGVIWGQGVGAIYWCVHIELIECHCIKINGDRLNILERLSLFNLNSGLRFPSITSQRNDKERFSNELIDKSKGGGGDEERRGGKSGEIIGKGRLKVRCGNYIAESEMGSDEISVRRLPHRTAMVPLSIPAIDEPFNYDFGDIRDRRSKLIKLDDNVNVLMLRERVTLINTTTGDILQHKQLPQTQPPLDILQPKQLPQPPLDICRWTEECFIVVFGKEMMVFNRDLCCLKTIKTEKYYNTIYKYNDNQLVCGGHYLRDITQEERDKKYQTWWYNNKDYYYCDDSDTFDSYYVDVVGFEDGEWKDEVCVGEAKRLGRFEGYVVVEGVGVTSFGDVVVVRREMEKRQDGFEELDEFCFVEWFREKSLVKRIRIEGIRVYALQGFALSRPRLTKIGECVYITDFDNNIYEIPGNIEEETFEDIVIQGFKDNPTYLLLREDENEVFDVLGLDVSENSLMVFGIIPGRQPFAFFHYDK